MVVAFRIYSPGNSLMPMQGYTGNRNYFVGKLGDTQNLASHRGGKKKQRPYLIQVSNFVEQNPTTFQVEAWAMGIITLKPLSRGEREQQESK